jgi:hypothetical protein
VSDPVASGVLVVEGEVIPVAAGPPVVGDPVDRPGVGVAAPSGIPHVGAPLLRRKKPKSQAPFVFSNFWFTPRKVSHSLISVSNFSERVGHVNRCGQRVEHLRVRV